MVTVGLTLQPEEAYLELLGGVLREDAEHLQVSPETMWRPLLPADAGGVRAGGFGPNAFHAQFLELARETRKPVVAHGVSLSPGSSAPDPLVRRHLLDRIRVDHGLFGFQWYTDHLGATELDGRTLVLPLPLPQTDASAAYVRASLAELQRIVPHVGVENSAFYFHIGDPREEPRFLEMCVAGAGMHLLLDLHNLHTNAVNADIDLEPYLAALPYEKVIEIHLSGGAWSDPAWLSSGASLRLDSHDSAVPDEVWELYERVLPRCSNLRGVTLERMEGTVADEDVPMLRDELRHARRVLEAVHD